MKCYTIFGPAGCGKSTAIINRVRTMVENGVDPQSIALVSFTRVAAQELATRIGNPNILACTIHSLAYKQAHVSQSQVINYMKLKEFGKMMGMDFTHKSINDDFGLSQGDEYLAAISLHRNAGIPAIEAFRRVSTIGTIGDFLAFNKAYADWKNATGFMDFEDMLALAITCPAPDIDWMYIDEAQDLSVLQWRLIEHWADTRLKGVCIIGDDDQTIYEWTGAQSSGMADFGNKYDSEVKVLGQSYRVPRATHKLAMKLISQVKKRAEKTYAPKDLEGEVRHHMSFDTIKLKHGDDVLIMYRNNSKRCHIEEFLIDRSLPYQIDGNKKGLLQGDEMRLIKVWEHLQWMLKNDYPVELSQSDQKLFNMNLDEPYLIRIKSQDWARLRGVTWVRAVKWDIPRVNYLKDIIDTYGMKVVPTIHISTIHGAKGREAEHVVLLNDMGFKTWEQSAVNMDAERRVFYVALTRTKNILDIVSGEREMI